jgi:hypothetical protein
VDAGALAQSPDFNIVAEGSNTPLPARDSRRAISGWHLQLRRFGRCNYLGVSGAAEMARAPGAWTGLAMSEVGHEHIRLHSVWISFGTHLGV